MYVFAVSCLSNADCKSKHPKSLCKEAVEGGSRSCEKEESCPVYCGQKKKSRYCSAKAKCPMQKESQVLN